LGKSPGKFPQRSSKYAADFVPGVAKSAAIRARRLLERRADPERYDGSMTDSAGSGRQTLLAIGEITGGGVNIGPVQGSCATRPTFSVNPLVDSATICGTI
jgi:hypothetical protein